MFNNSWFKKERPIITMMGLGGGATGLPMGGAFSCPTDPFSASGGSKFSLDSKTWHLYSSPGTFVADGQSQVCEFFVLAGGGGGSNGGAGGGAGGVITSFPDAPTTWRSSDITITCGTYNITVGSGGAGAPTSGSQLNADPGGDSSIILDGVSSQPFTSVIANGGGGGGGGGSLNPEPGGSGGGGMYGSNAGGTALKPADWPKQRGYDGATGGAAPPYDGGGGGGSASAGGIQPDGTPQPSLGIGGGATYYPGIPASDILPLIPVPAQNSINPGNEWSDENEMFAGGGGGGNNYSGNNGGGGGSGNGGGAYTNGNNAKAHTGSGGGGGGNDGTHRAGGNGAAGFIIIRYS